MWNVTLYGHALQYFFWHYSALLVIALKEKNRNTPIGLHSSCTHTHATHFTPFYLLILPALCYSLAYPFCPPWHFLIALPLFFMASVLPECLLILRAASLPLCKTSPTSTQWQQLPVIVLVRVCVYICFFFFLTIWIIWYTHTHTDKHANRHIIKPLTHHGGGESLVSVTVQPSWPLLLVLDSGQRIGVTGCHRRRHSSVEPCLFTRDRGGWMASEVGLAATRGSQLAPSTFRQQWIYDAFQEIDFDPCCYSLPLIVSLLSRPIVILAGTPQRLDPHTLWSTTTSADGFSTSMVHTVRTLLISLLIFTFITLCVAWPQYLSPPCNTAHYLFLTGYK